MTESKEKNFLDWLFGSSVATETSVQVGDTHLQIEELQREMERERASGLAELEAVRVSRAEAEAARVRCQGELEQANREQLTLKAALESAQAEIARLTLAAADARKASARDAEASRKVSGRCSSLQFEIDKLRSVLETQSKRETELDQALQLQRAALEDAQAAAASQRADLLEQEERTRTLEQAAAQAQTEFAAQRAELLEQEERTRTLEQAAAQAKVEFAAQRAELLEQEERTRALQQAAAHAKTEFAELESVARTQLSARQAELEQRQKELTLARADVERLQKELKRQQASFIQASGRQQASLEAERRAWAAWLGQVWNTLLYTLGPAAPLALETCLGALEPVAQAATTEAAEARLREYLAACSLCRNVAIVEQQSELRLELEAGSALEGTAAGWVGILATRQLAAMLQRPLCTRGVEQAGALLTVHTTSRTEDTESTAVYV